MNSVPSKNQCFSTHAKIVLLVTFLLLVALAALACLIKSLILETPSSTAFFEFVAVALLLLVFYAVAIGIFYLRFSKTQSVWKPDKPAGQSIDNLKTSKPRFTFGIWSMLLITFASAVTAAAGSYYVKALKADTSPKAVFIIFAIAAPMLMLVFVSASYQVSRMLKQRKKQKRDVYEYNPDDG